MLNVAHSGVDVVGLFMMTDWPDKKLALHALPSPTISHSFSLAGRIFRYTKGFFHAKSITVDGELCAAGTINLDIRSLKVDKELMVWVFDGDIVRAYEGSSSTISRTVAKSRWKRCAAGLVAADSGTPPFRLLSHLM